MPRHWYDWKVAVKLPRSEVWRKWSWKWQGWQFYKHFQKGVNSGHENARVGNLKIQRSRFAENWPSDFQGRQFDNIPLIMEKQIAENRPWNCNGLVKIAKVGSVIWLPAPTSTNWVLKILLLYMYPDKTGRRCFRKRVDSMTILSTGINDTNISVNMLG